jgi:hypothetical protein
MTGILLTAGYAQNLDTKDIPKVVIEKFNSGFPKAANVKWTMEKSNYEASFITRKKEMLVNFDEKGNGVKTEVEIKLSELPIEIRTSISKNFSGYKIIEITKIKTRGITTYVAEVTHGKDKMDLKYDDHGVLQSKKSKDSGERR